MNNIDLHALRVLDEIYQTGSLSRTAERLGLTQPAISLALSKLRQHFDDALFVRVGNVMRPTPHTQGMIDSVRAAISAIEQTFHYRTHFDPSSTDRIFRVSMTDIGQIVVLPRLLEVIRRDRLSLRIEISNISDRTPQILEAGEIDLAVGFIPQLQAGFFQQALFQERFACLARKDHPRVKRELTQKLYQQESHVIVQTSGTGHLIVDRTLAALGLRRRVAVSIPNFLGLATLIGHTDCLCTLPRRAALIMAGGGEVRAWEVPFEVPSYKVKQHWHERQARDPGSRWLRSTLSGLFSAEVPGVPGVPAGADPPAA